jgi:hypothetical protein
MAYELIINGTKSFIMGEEKRLSQILTGDLSGTVGTTRIITDHIC